MTHEEICTYEVCKLAKEKGFNVQTFDWYDYTGNYNKGFIPHKLHECPRYKEYYAPTQSLLQRWLREEKGIIIELKYSDDTESFRPFWSWQIYNTLGITLEIGEPNTTYELALEDALAYSLKNLV
jgi:hypothetical protein